MLKAGPLKKFFGSDGADSSARAEILEFGDIPFEQAKVEVEIEGRIRTFNIETPQTGHPMTIELDELDFDSEGEPTEDSVIKGLRDSLSYV